MRRYNSNLKEEQRPIPSLSQSSDMSESSPIEDPREYFSKLLWAMSTNLSLLTQENIDKLVDTLLDSESEFDTTDNFKTVYTFLNSKLRKAVHGGLEDEFELAQYILSNVQEMLREHAPVLLYSGPVDEGADELLGSFKNLPLKTKMKYAAFGTLLAASLGMAGNYDYELAKNEMTPEEYYQDYYRECFERNPELYKEFKAEEEGEEEKSKEGEQEVKRLSGDFMISQDGINHIKDMEKLVLEPYFPTTREKMKYSGRKDNIGKTIGYGHVITSEDKDLLNVESITEEQANELLLKDCKSKCAALQRDIKLLKPELQDPSLYSQGFIDGMTSFIFNIGNGNFLNKSNTWKTWKACRVDKETGKIRKDDYEWLMHALRNDFLTDTGHTPRRRAESNLMRN